MLELNGFNSMLHRGRFNKFHNMNKFSASSMNNVKFITKLPCGIRLTECYVTLLLGIYLYIVWQIGYKTRGC